MVTSFDFRASATLHDLAVRVRTEVHAQAICFVHNFPLDGENLVSFASQFGQVMPRRGNNFTDFSRFVGDVRYKTEIPVEKRMSTQTANALPLHTARSSEHIRPTYFLMCKACHGFVGQPGSNGESVFLRWTDLFNQYQNIHARTFDDDILLFSSIRVSTHPEWLQDEPTTEPILRPSENQFYMRYWEHLPQKYKLEDAESIRPRYQHAVDRLDTLMNETPARIICNLEEGQLVVLDNRRVAHGRCSFIPSITQNGKAIPSPRQMYTCHIL